MIVYTYECGSCFEEIQLMNVDNSLEVEFCPFCGNEIDFAHSYAPTDEYVW